MKRVQCKQSHSPVKSSSLLMRQSKLARVLAVVVVSLVHAFFHLHGLGEMRVTLQADNCVGQNKNATMMWYLAWRVITGQHDRIQLNIMYKILTRLILWPVQEVLLQTRPCRWHGWPSWLCLPVWPECLVCRSCCTRTGSTMIGMPSWISGLVLCLALRVVFDQEHPRLCSCP